MKLCSFPGSPRRFDRFVRERHFPRKIDCHPDGRLGERRRWAQHPNSAAVAFRAIDVRQEIRFDVEDCLEAAGARDAVAGHRCLSKKQGCLGKMTINHTVRHCSLLGDHQST
jgi:hypothetical protein